MIIYEVNLDIQNDIYTAYMAWLKPHIKEMLNFPGFIRATIQSEQLENHKGSKKTTVSYTIENMNVLEDYLQNHSKAMRDDGINKFGDKFSATRRIFCIEETLTN